MSRTVGIAAFPSENVSVFQAAVAASVSPHPTGWKKLAVDQRISRWESMCRFLLVYHRMSCTLQALEDFNSTFHFCLSYRAPLNFEQNFGIIEANSWIKNFRNKLLLPVQWVWLDKIDNWSLHTFYCTPSQLVVEPHFDRVKGWNFLLRNNSHAGYTMLLRNRQDNCKCRNFSGSACHRLRSLLPL